MFFTRSFSQVIHSDHHTQLNSKLDSLGVSIRILEKQIRRQDLLIQQSLKRHSEHLSNVSDNIEGMNSILGRYENKLDNIDQQYSSLILSLDSLNMKIPDSLQHMYFFTEDGKKLAFIGDLEGETGYTMVYSENEKKAAFLGTDFNFSNRAVLFGNRGNENISLASYGDNLGGMEFSFTPSIELLELNEIVDLNGYLICMNETGEYKPCSEYNSPNAIGVLNINYTISRNDKSFKCLSVGRTKIRVNTEGGDIRSGDLLVTSSHAGYATKGKGKRKNVVAIAMEDSKGQNDYISVQLKY